MAPEQFRGLSTKAADIFAFGVVLFEMIAGARPYPKEDILATALRRVCDDAPGLRSVSPAVAESWDRAVARALQRSPDERQARAGAIVPGTESRTCWAARALSGTPVCMSAGADLCLGERSASTRTLRFYPFARGRLTERFVTASFLHFGS